LLPPSIRRRLTFSNVIALTALALALGGVSYAAVTLPDHSVGTRQLQGHSVTAGKLAKGAVKRRALSRSLRKRIARSSSGATAQVTGRIHYSDTSSASPASKTVLDFAGLKLTATCTLSGPTTLLTMSAKSPTSALLTSNFNVDAGTDPSSPGGIVSSGNNQIALPAGADVSLSGPGADTPNNYVRVIATGIYTTSGRTISLIIEEFVDGGAGTCAVDGTAQTAT